MSAGVVCDVMCSNLPARSTCSAFG